MTYRNELSLSCDYVDAEDFQCNTTIAASGEFVGGVRDMRRHAMGDGWRHTKVAAKVNAARTIRVDLCPEHSSDRHVQFMAGRLTDRVRYPAELAHPHG